MMKAVTHPVLSMHRSADPSPESPHDVVLHPDYTVVQERPGTVNALVVRHRITGTLWSCHYTDSGWSLPQPWYEVAVSTEVVQQNLKMETALTERREVVAALADVLRPTQGRDAMKLAVELVDTAMSRKRVGE